jgi:hypothetical protein
LRSFSDPLASANNAARWIGTIIGIVILFAALYPAAALAHVAWRIILAGWS